MSLVWIEGFESFETSTSVSLNTSLLLKYPYISGNWSSRQGKSLGGISMHGSSISVINTPVFTPESDSWIVGFAFKADTLDIINRDILKFRQDGSITHDTLTLKATNGELIFSRADTSTIATSAFGGLTTGTWYYIEVRVLIADTLGEYEVKVNETVVLSGTADTRNGGRAAVNNIQFIAAAGSSFDDIYIIDMNTGTDNINFLGTSIIRAIKPAGSGNNTDWNVTGAANNYLAVSEIPNDSDTSYVSTSTSTSIDTYEMSDLIGIGDVYGLQVNMLARKDDHGSKSIKSVIVSDVSGTPTQELGETKYLNDNYRYYSQISENNPDNGSAWTIGDIEDSQFGVNLNS